MADNQAPKHVDVEKRDAAGLLTCSYSSCVKKFRRPGRLKIHARTHTGERPFVCTEEGCNKCYCRPAHLQRHQRNAHTPQTQQTRAYIRCTEEECQGLFTTKQNLLKHIQRKHQHRYKCEVEGCGQTFQKHHQLRSHGYIHTNIDPYTCSHPGCGRTFKWPNLLRRHLKVHQGYKCDFSNCSLVFKKWSDLRRHKSEAHAPGLKCDQCSKTFTKHHHLTVHRRVHDSQRSIFQCPHNGCERVYLDKRNLKTHLQRFHDKQRFSCSHPGCDKTFASKQKSQEHAVLHSAIRACSPKKVTKRSKPAKSKKARRKKSLASWLTGLREDLPVNEDFQPLTLQPVDDHTLRNRCQPVDVRTVTSGYQPVDDCTVSSGYQPVDGHIMVNECQLVNSCAVTSSCQLVDGCTISSEYQPADIDTVTNGCQIVDADTVTNGFQPLDVYTVTTVGISIVTSTHQPINVCTLTNSDQPHQEQLEWNLVDLDTQPFSSAKPAAERCQDVGTDSGFVKLDLYGDAVNWSISNSADLHGGAVKLADCSEGLGDGASVGLCTDRCPLDLTSDPLCVQPGKNNPSLQLSDESCSVISDTTGADGNPCADAVYLSL